MASQSELYSKQICRLLQEFSESDSENNLQDDVCSDIEDEEMSPLHLEPENAADGPRLPTTNDFTFRSQKGTLCEPTEGRQSGRTSASYY